MLNRQHIKNLDSILKRRDITLLTKMGTTEDEMVGWHHRLKGHEFEQALRVGDGRGAWHAAVHQDAKSQKRLSS